MAKTKSPQPRAQRITLLLSEKERRDLDRAAADQGVSRADILRSSFRNYTQPTTRRDA